MKKLISLLALGLTLAVGVAHAADGKTPTAQQGKMKTCNVEAESKVLKGAERTTFMKECLSAKAAVATDGKSTQQEKMKTCNVEAKSKVLRGAERKTFMKECLSAK